MKRLHKIPLGIAAFFLGLGMVFMPGTASMATTVSGSANTNTTSDLTELFILDRLFSDSESGDRIFGGDSDLGELFILERLFAGDGVLSGQRTVVVESGDTLSGIAQTYLGDASRYREIAALNNIEDPNLIFPGQVLTLPGTSTNVGTSTTNNLTELFILDRLFSNGESGDNIMSGDSNLGELFILERLFAGDQTVVTTDPETRTVTEPRTVVVQEGDTLSGIAQTHLGDASRFDEIADMNDIEDPDLIFPGQVLELPGTTTRTITIGGGTTTTVGTQTDLTELFILDRLFSDSGESGDGLFGGDSDLGQLIILERLFGNNTSGFSFGSGQSDLTELFILDRLFSESNERTTDRDNTTTTDTNTETNTTINN